MPQNNKKWLLHPKILEVNTWSWLKSLSESYGNPIKLDNIPVQLIDLELTAFDVIWCMGVWERSPKSRDIAIKHEGLQQEYRNALRYFNTEDVIGSPYSIFYYHVDSHLGGGDALATFRKELAERQISLILDYVPNHIAIDHLWTFEKSNLLIKGSLNDQILKPYDYFSIGNIVYAHGRDPNFPPWTDTVQINAFSDEARTKAIKTLLTIADQCDGVRCDMAMLMTNRVFSKTWGDKAGDIPEKEFWEYVITEVKEKYPNFIFIAEVYWDMERELLKQGFDYCYDKKLYKLLQKGVASDIQNHIQAEWDYKKKLLHFIENHDEKRAVTTFGIEGSKIAAIISYTLPGARLFYEGQMQGYEIKIPVQLGRNPTEVGNNSIQEFYTVLLKAIPGREYDDGKCTMSKINSIGAGDLSYNNILSYYWKKEEKIRLIVVNYSYSSSKAHVVIENMDYGLSEWEFHDLIHDKTYVYNGKDLNNYGVYIELEGLDGHIFDIKKW